MDILTTTVLVGEMSHPCGERSHALPAVEQNGETRSEYMLANDRFASEAIVVTFTNTAFKLYAIGLLTVFDASESGRVERDDHVLGYCALETSCLNRSSTDTTFYRRR